MTLNTTPRTWVAGETVTAALMNQEIRDALTGIQAAWSSYTPTITAAGTNPSLGNGSTLGTYARVGKTVLVRGRVLFGSTSTFGSGTYTISLPVAPTGATLLVGTALIVQGVYYSTMCLVSGSGFTMQANGASSGASSTVPATFTATGAIYFQCAYEAA